MREALKIGKKVGKNIVIFVLLMTFLVVAHAVPALITGHVDPALSV